MKQFKTKINHAAAMVQAVFSGKEYLFLQVEKDRTKAIQHISLKMLFKGLKTYFKGEEILIEDFINYCFDVEKEMKKLNNKIEQYKREREELQKQVLKELPDEFRRLFNIIKQDFKNN